MCQCYTLPCTSYPMQAVTVRNPFGFLNGKRWVRKCSADCLLSTGSTQNSKGHPPPDARDQLHYKFCTLLTRLFSQLPAHPKACPQPPSKSNSEATPSLTSSCRYYFPRKAHYPLLPRLQGKQGRNRRRVDTN